MTEQELREKIVKIALNTSWTDMFGDHYSIGESAANAIADTLIAAGIGDVKEVEHRAEVAERALKEAVDRYIGVDCLCHGTYDAECKDCNEYCNIKYLEIEEAVPCAMNKFLQQAEKELAEEGKDD